MTTATFAFRTGAPAFGGAGFLLRFFAATTGPKIDFYKYEVWRLQRLARMLGACRSAEERARWEKESHDWRHMYVFALEEVMERLIMHSQTANQNGAEDPMALAYRQMVVAAIIKAKKAKETIVSGDSDGVVTTCARTRRAGQMTGKFQILLKNIKISLSPSV
jgi:hypothetical protein